MTNDATTEKVQAAPLTMSSTKHEILTHLVTVHGIGYVDRQTIYSTNGKYDCKASKERLLQVHNTYHETLDASDREVSNGTAYHNRRSAQLPVVEHVHTAAEATGLSASEATDEQREAASRVIRGERISDKPLPAGERKVLMELVNNDFDSLEQEMRALAADHLTARKAELKEEWQERRAAAPEFVKTIQKIERKARRKVEDQVRKAREAGVVVQEANWRYFNPRSEFEGYTKAQREVEKENQEFLSRALMSLQRQRLEAQRRILISGVTEESAKILETIPDAKTLMIQAGMNEAQAPKEISQSPST
jgi:hypothetical protein